MNAAADFPVSTVDADLAYVTSTGDSDGLFAGIGSNQRIGKFNTVFRVNTSVAVEHATALVRSGTLLFGECSYTMPYGEDLVYLNGFWGIDHFSSAARSPSAGGPLGRVGILNAAVGLGRYGAPLSNQADNAVGGALGTYGSAAAGGVDQATLDLNVTFIAAARGDALLAEGRILRRGRSIAFGETRVTDTAGTLVALGRATYMIIPPRP